MDAQAHVVVESDGSRIRYRTLRSDPPLLLRPTAEALYLVGGSAGPLGGDALQLNVTVRAGAHLVVRSAAATCLLPRRDEPSTLDLNVSVEDGATLEWRPEPTISVMGSDHRQRTRITLEGSANLRWHEHLVLGRWSEPPGRLTSSLRVTRDDVVLSHQDQRIDGMATAPTILGSAREVETAVLVGHPGLHGWTETVGSGGTTFALTADAVMHQRIGATIALTPDEDPLVQPNTAVGSTKEPAR